MEPARNGRVGAVEMREQAQRESVLSACGRALSGPGFFLAWFGTATGPQVFSRDARSRIAELYLPLN